jgi:hypothetical protein
MKGNNHLRELDRGGGKLVGHGKDGKSCTAAVQLLYRDGFFF